MSPKPSSERRWWERRAGSLTTFAVVLGVAAVAALVLGQRAADVLGEVGKDHLGDDAWTDPLGVELAGSYEIGHLPDCAADPITRIVLWDASSEPFWEVSGPPTPVEAFFVGAAPAGFTEVVPFEEPPAGEVLRLVVFRRSGEVAGLRYQRRDLREGRVMSGRPLRSYTVDGFREAGVCGDTAGATDPEAGLVDGIDPTGGLGPVDGADRGEGTGSGDATDAGDGG